MLWALLRHLDADFGAVVIDAKGDPELVERCRAAARARGRAFYGPCCLTCRAAPTRAVPSCVMRRRAASPTPLCC
jgi:hypothetical protein